MTRISTLCVLSSTLAVLALSANIAGAETITPHVPPPHVPPPPKFTVHPNTLKPKIQSNTPKTKAFEIKDFSFGVENPTTVGSATGGAGAGKIKFNEITIKKTTDSVSPTLQLQPSGSGISGGSGSGNGSGSGTGGGIAVGSGNGNGSGTGGGIAVGSGNGNGSGTGGGIAVGSGNGNGPLEITGSSSLKITPHNPEGTPNLIGGTNCNTPGCGGPPPK